MWYTIIVALALLGASLVEAHDDTCSTRYGFDIDFPGTSCVDIYNKNPTSHGRSGYYVLKTDHLFFAYCDMELDCGGIKGGWMRVADIKKEILALVDGLDTTLSIVQEDQQLVVIPLTFQLTLQATARCVGRQWDIRRELWMAFTHMPMLMEKLNGTHKLHITVPRWSVR